MLIEQNVLPLWLSYYYDSVLNNIANLSIFYKQLLLIVYGIFTNTIFFHQFLKIVYDFLYV